MKPEIFMSARGKYKTRALAEKYIPEGYEIVEEPDGFYGVKITKGLPVCKRPLLERNQIIMSGIISDLERIELEPDEIKEDVMPIFSTLDIICPQCGSCHFETTDQYDPEKHVHSGMLRLKEPYASYGWMPPPPDPSAGSGSLECAECGALIAPEGKFRTRSQVSK